LLNKVQQTSGCGIAMKNTVKPCAFALRRICNGKPELQLNKEMNEESPKNKFEI
jgi:hypothetical protein